jgi:ADP-heptose:LPS heptosyltransferase
MGDVVLTTGVLAYLAEHKGLRFSVVTRKAFAPLFASHPGVTELIGLEEEELKGREWRKTARRLAAGARGAGLLDLHKNTRTFLLSTMWKGPVRRYPKHAITRRALGATSWCAPLKEHFRAVLGDTNVPQRYVRALLPVPPGPEELIPRLYLSAEESQSAARLLAERGITTPAVALHPYAKHPTKAWPWEHWQELAERLRMLKIPCFVIGRDEHPHLADIFQERDLSNLTGLRMTAALLQQAGALLTNDSGPMHLGTAVGTPVTALFGPTVKEWGFAPSGPGDIVLQSDQPCRPCSLHGKKPCPKDQACLRDISPESVLSAILSQLPHKP